MAKAQKVKELKQAILDGKEIEFHYLYKEWVQANTTILTHIKKYPNRFRIKGELK